MAGDVEIRGGGNLDGAMLRNAATESTLRELVNALNAKDGKSGNKAAQEHERAVKNNVTAIKSSSDNLSVYNNTISNLNKNSGKLRESFARMSNSTIGGVFSGIATVGKSLLGFFTDSLGSFRETSQVGATFNNDLIELRRTAASAAMPLDMFTDMLKNNSRILAAFGGTVTGGAQRFAELSKSLRTGDIGARFMGMGMTMSDLNESMAEYLDLEMRAGRLENRSNADLLQGTQNYIMEMDKLTKITGLSRRQQSEALRGAMADGRLLNLQNSLSGEALQRFRSSVTLMQANMDPQAMGTIINAMSGIIDPSDRFGKFMANAVPDFLSFNRAMGEGALTTEEVVEGAEKQIRAIDGYLAGYSREQIARTPELRRMREYQQSLRAMARANTASAQEEQARRNTITEAMGSFGQTIQKIKDDILIKLIDSNVFGRVQTALTAVGDIILRNSGAFGDGLVKIVDSIFKFIENIQSKGIGQAVTELLQGMFKSLARNVISSMFSLIADNLGTVLVGMAAGIAALFLAPWAGIFGAIGAAIIAVIGYDQVKQWLSSSLEAIKNLGTSIANMFNWQSISGFFTDAWNSISGIPNRIESLFNLSSVTEMFSSVWNTISGIPSKIMEFFNIESVGVMFSSAWNTISGIPSKIMEFFNIESVGQLFGSAWNTISGIPSKIMEFFNIESVSAMFSSAWNTISGIPTKILEFFNIESVSAMFSSAWNTISGIPTKILEFFNVDSVSSMFSNAWNTISGIPTKILEFFNVDSVGQLFGNAWNTISGIPTKILEYFNLGSVSSMFSNAWNTISGIPTKILEFFNVGSVGQLFGNAWNTISGIPTKILEFFNVDSVSSMFSNAWNTISGIPTKILEFFNVDSVSSMFSNAWNTISGIPTKILEFFNVDSVGQLFGNAWNTISGIPTKILEFFNVDSVGQLFGNAWNTISGIPTKIRELFSLENLNLPKISDLFNSLVSTVRGFFNFDFQLPNIRDFLPTWLGGTGRARTEIADVQQNRAEPNTTSRDQSRTVDNADARVREYRARLANARLTNIPDTTTTGDDLTLDYLKYPETGRPPPGATSLAMPQAPETSNRINTEELSTQVASTNRELIAALNVLKEHLDKLSTGNSETAASLTNIVSPLASTLGTVTNTMIEEQRKLNTMIAELRPVFEATRDSTKNVADNVGGRNSPL